MWTSSARFLGLLGEILMSELGEVNFLGEIFCSSARRFYLGEEKTVLAEEKARRRGDSGREDCYLILNDKEMWSYSGLLTVFRFIYVCGMLWNDQCILVL